MEISPSLLYSKKNIFLINNLRAIAIIGVVYGHLIAFGTPIGDICSKFITMFFLPIAMPLFSFSSGFYHSREVYQGKSNVSVEKTLSLFLVGFVLLIPWRWYSEFVVNDIPFSLSDFLYFTFLPFPKNYSILWYIIAVVIWRLIAPIVVKIKYHLLLVFLVGSLSCFMGDEWYRGVFRYMPFYFIGLDLTWEKIIEIRNTAKKYYSILALFLAGVMAALFKFILDIPFSPGNFKETGVLNYLLITLLYYFISASCISCLFGFFPGRKIWAFTKVGTNCMTVYFLHIYIVNAFAGYWLFPYLHSLGAPAIMGVAVQIVIFAATIWLSSLDSITRLIGVYTNLIYDTTFKH